MTRELLRQLWGRTTAPQLRRFVVVGTLGSGLQLSLLWLFVDGVGLDYLVGATVAIELTIVFTYVLNNVWTFRHSRNVGAKELLVGLLKTNVVRGSAIPLQLVILFALVEWYDRMYLVANLVAIGISGLYRYTLDARWTWSG